jgi:ABC-2 type transport system ATP-binding protein
MHTLEVTSLRKSFAARSGTVEAVKNVSFSVSPNEIVGLLGPNGAGKTSVVKMISGVLLPDAGTVFVNGRNMMSDRRARAMISTVLEGSRNMYWQLTAKENLVFFAGIHGISRKVASPKADEVLAMLSLTDKSSTPVGSLSRGMQQKLAFGIAMMKEVPLIILDEPTLGLDVEATTEMRRLLTEYVKSGNRSVLITTHDMQLVESICDRSIIMSRGRILTDSPVSDLKRLFESRAYKLSISGQTRRLIELLAGHEADPEICDEADGRLQITVTLPDPRQLFSLLDLFRNEDACVESIEKDEIRFEDIFLSVIHKEGERV